LLGAICWKTTCHSCCQSTRLRSIRSALERLGCDTLADDLAAVIRETAAYDVTLVGFSMGGGEVARYLSRYQGDKVRQAILISSVVPLLQQTADNPHGIDPGALDLHDRGHHRRSSEVLVRVFQGFLRGRDLEPASQRRGARVVAHRAGAIVLAAAPRDRSAATRDRLKNVRRVINESCLTRSSPHRRLAWAVRIGSAGHSNSRARCEQDAGHFRTRSNPARALLSKWEIPWFTVAHSIAL
jgi:pimeloyl-ACP methyl ester carboxylesterase